MKTSLRYTPVFTPGGSNVGTLNYSTFTDTDGSGFNLAYLYAIINVTQGVVIYATGIAGLGGTLSSGVLTLKYNTSSFNAGDIIETLYDVRSSLEDANGNAINSLLAGTGQNGLMVATGATNYVLSTNNSSTAQLTAGSTFTGVIESIFNEPAVSVLLTSDQPGTLTINQYIDLAGTRSVQPIVYNVTAGVGISRSLTINGNYINVAFKNTGSSTTTTFNLNVAYGTIPATTPLGNMPSAINEIGGVAVGSGNLPIVSGADNITLYSGTISATGTQPAILTTGYNSLSIQLAGSWTGNAFIQGSLDGVNYINLLVQDTSYNISSDILIANTIYSLPVSTKYVQLNVAELVGSISATILGKSTVMPDASQIIAQGMDSSTGQQLNVNVAGGLQVDSTSGLILSDCAQTQQLRLATGSFVIIDTKGYQSLHLSCSLGTASTTSSNDGITYAVLNFVLSSGSVGNNTIPINQTVEIPCVGRYIKITASAAFAATICLRQGSHFTNANIISISGATPVSTGVSGILAVGGNIANGVAPTANPNLVAGIDTTGLTRRVLTDTAGRVLVSGVTQAGATAALPLFGNSATPSLAQTDTGTIDSFTQYDLLAEVVTQLRILNRNFFEANVGQLSPVSDDPDVLRADYSTLTTLN